VKNRSRLVVADGLELQLFPNCVRSIVACTAAIPDVELVVSDWGSDDWPLDDWLPAAAGAMPVTVVPVEGNFSRGRGLNVAAHAARHDRLLFLDADVLACEALFRRSIELTATNTAYFPILFSFSDPQHSSGWWRKAGYGICALPRHLLQQAGGWPEYTTWGKEDGHLFQAVSRAANVVRERLDGFYHQWHPDDREWKNRYGTGKSAWEEEKERFAEMKRQIEAAVPPDTAFILVDDQHWGRDFGRGPLARPFLERDGEYWGHPPDDRTAILELERMRAEGAKYIAFCMPTFWWLEHYPGLDAYLRANFDLSHTSDDVRVFCLRA
jgi:glycosyltransferase involved in cell wall biosynthesis